MDYFDFELYVSLFLFALAYWRHPNLFKCCVCAYNKSFNMSSKLGDDSHARADRLQCSLHPLRTY